MTTYNCYRLLLSYSPQKKLFTEKISKEELLKISIEKLIDKKYELQYRGNQYFIYYHEKLADDVVVLQLAKVESFRRYSEFKNRIVPVNDTQTPFVYFIVDLQRQIVLIEVKSNVFADVEFAENRIRQFFTKEFASEGILVNLLEISEQQEFWSQVEEAERIYAIEIQFNPPNLFEGRQNAAELIEEEYERTNFTDFKIRLANKFGKLKLLKQNFQDFIALIAAGGGRYKVITNRKGSRKRISSNSNVIQKELPNDPKTIDVFGLITFLKSLDRKDDNAQSQ